MERAAPVPAANAQSPDASLRMQRLSRRPTGRGALLLLCAMGLFLLGTHFSSNAVFLLAFFCFSLPLAACLSVWSVPKRIAVQPLNFSPVAAGTRSVLSYRLVPAPKGAARMVLETGLAVATAADDSGHIWNAHLPPMQRGIYQPEQISLVALDPLGLFRTARRLSRNERRAVPPLVIYPQPDWANAALPAGARNAGMSVAQMGEIAGLRPYRSGDGRRAVDWRASAKLDDLVVREYERTVERDSCIFDWAELPGQDMEHKLSQVAAGVLQAARDGLAIGLRLPGHDLPPRRGPRHVDDMLQLLAGFGADQASVVTATS